jgi:ribosomal protein S18 acetylase RimI-like enzyme
VTYQPLREADYARVLTAVSDWWDEPALAGRAAERVSLVPRLFFQHFGDTSFLLEQDGELLGFLIGFLSQSQPAEAYIHFVGVAPSARRRGIGSAQYEHFFELARARGRTTVHCITSPGNTRSIAFHRGLGFAVAKGDRERDGVAFMADYDGPGLDRVVFSRSLLP